MSELARLIEEQRRDDVPWTRPETGIRTAPLELLSAARRLVVSDPRHGTLYAYTRLRCRCERCRAVSAAAKRSQRARKRRPSVPYTYVSCCADCGSRNVKRQRVPL